MPAGRLNMGDGRQAEQRPSSNAKLASALIAAIEKYDRHVRLEGVAAAAAGLARALAEGGIANAYPDCLRGGRSQELAEQVLAWMRNANEEDRLDRSCENRPCANARASRAG
jgi:hypothetical protein